MEGLRSWDLSRAAWAQSHNRSCTPGFCLHTPRLRSGATILCARLGGGVDDELAGTFSGDVKLKRALLGDPPRETACAAKQPDDPTASCLARWPRGAQRGRRHKPFIETKARRTEPGSALASRGAEPPTPLAILADGWLQFYTEQLRRPD